jgi:DNA-binding XRE family transcriptional regulator
MLIDQRVRLGMSREKLSQAIHYGATYVRDVEQATKLPPLEVALAMAGALELDSEQVTAAWKEAAGCGSDGARAGMTDRTRPEATPATRTGRRRTFAAVAAVVAVVGAVCAVGP